MAPGETTLQRERETGPRTEPAPAPAPAGTHTRTTPAYTCAHACDKAPEAAAEPKERVGEGQHRGANDAERVLDSFAEPPSSVTSACVATPPPAAAAGGASGRGDTKDAPDNAHTAEASHWGSRLCAPWHSRCAKAAPGTSGAPLTQWSSSQRKPTPCSGTDTCSGTDNAADTKAPRASSSHSPRAGRQRRDKAHANTPAAVASGPAGAGQHVASTTRWRSRTRRVGTAPVDSPATAEAAKDEAEAAEGDAGAAEGEAGAAEGGAGAAEGEAARHTTACALVPE